MADASRFNRSYRRGAIMGLTMAEAFILIAFALLLLFAFWQWETEKENTPEVQAFKELPYEQRQTVLVGAQDGSIKAFAELKESGVDFSSPASVEKPQEKWRFIDKGEVLRLVDAASSLPEDMQRDLADMVESQEAQEILKEMAVLEKLVESGRRIADLIDSSDISEALEESGRSVEELLAVSQIIESLENSGHSIDDLEKTAQALEALQEDGRTMEDILRTAQTLAVLEQAGQKLEDISAKIKNAEAQEAALVGALRTELGGLVSSIGGQIDENGAIILPDTVLFDQGKANITPVLAKFLADACSPWLAVLKNSGVDVSEVKIEGHASSEWRSGSSPRQAYLGNLDLSQRRSQAVLQTCMDFVTDSEVLDWARKHLIAVGYSSVRPVLRDGKEDKIASRRVVFSATPNRESLIQEIETEATKTARYDRSLFGGWEDRDGDCLNTRHELLATMSTGQVTYTRNRCAVFRGRWVDSYTGKTFYQADDVDIDHLVPLKWAWEHGADKWPSQRRKDFGNDPANLFIVHDQVNQDKGAMGPDEWLPPKVDFRCQYVTRFRRVVLKYGLILSDDEREAFARISQQSC